MAARDLKFSIIFTVFTVFLFCQELYASPFWSVHGKRVRRKLEVCADGSYPHEGNNCCECAAGQRLKQHCNATHLVTCELCEYGTFNSGPNHLDHCSPCTSCNQPNANLEEEDACTPGRDAKCRCKKDHYCSETKCKICQPCKKCESVGIKVPCTPTNDTVCNTEPPNPHVIAAIVVPLLLVILGILAFFGYKYLKRKKMQQESANCTGGTSDERNPIRDEPIPMVEVQPLILDIAETLGWRDMKDLAIRSGIPDTRIDNVRLNHPYDAEEACLSLLRIWVERKGRNASVELVQNLRGNGKRDKAEKILEILRK
uniref:Tumor necrosis factor receptor superfamily member 6 n=2 Tax=Nothobranchius rachovii TaxID=451742 RepID=A0A1A8S4A4_9TELE